jgi:hypothetical protein
MLLDTSVRQQIYVEDCEVCCNPIEVEVKFENHELVQFEPQNLGQ